MLGPVLALLLACLAYIIFTILREQSKRCSLLQGSSCVSGKLLVLLMMSSFVAPAAGADLASNPTSAMWCPPRVSSKLAGSRGTVGHESHIMACGEPAMSETGGQRALCERALDDQVRI